MAVLLETPFFVYLYLLNDFLYEGYLVDFHPKITIFLVSFLLLLLPFYLRASFLAEMFVFL